MLTREQKKNRKIWVEALRSGKYEQAAGRLCTVGDAGHGAEFCCLGVWLHIGDDSDWVPDGACADDYGCTAFIPAARASNDAHVLTRRERKPLGLTTTQMDTLIDMNDGPHTFNNIADQIDAWTKEGR